MSIWKETADNVPCHHHDNVVTQRTVQLEACVLISFSIDEWSSLFVSVSDLMVSQVHFEDESQRRNFT